LKERNLLVGNGINIAASKNNDYKNFEIISRLTKNLETNRYDDVFNKSITSTELLIILHQLNDYFNKMLVGLHALKITQTDDEMVTLIDISRRYNSKNNDLISVGIEDYFFVMKMVFNQVGDEDTPLNALYDGLKHLFLDSIYNDGAIETLYTKLSPYSNELNKYKSIFTVNYDTNLDKLTQNTVYHLHGSFDMLDDTYRNDTILGYLADKNQTMSTVIETKSHLFCNAIMAFSGNKKLEIINTYSNSNVAMNEIINRLSDPLDFEAQQYFEKLKKSTKEKDIFAYQSIFAKLNNASLQNTEYPIDNLRNINGELDILGMSPNNDSHIFDIINSNVNLKNVVYYSASDEDSFAAQRIIKKPLQIRNVHKYWKSIGL
jgi:hypothetical protein